MNMTHRTNRRTFIAGAAAATAASSLPMPAIAQNPPLEAEKLIDGLLEPERRRQKRQMVEAMESMLRAVYDARR